ncbi:MAG: AAA family ATPase [Defluviitaleaceae bacterium]|nr:AAA family ATPase [Defluviitaleaceae bacterium]
MLFYVCGNAFYSVEPVTFPAMCLRSDNWNDFGFYTVYYADYYGADMNKIELGAIKILKRGERRTPLDNKFERLSTEYCSVGNRHYYKKLKEISMEIYYYVLTALCDCIYDDKIAESFRYAEGFRDSLNRDGNFISLKKWFDLFSNNITDDPREFQFKFFSCLGIDNEGSVEAEFDFTEINEHIPNRINVLVGKNGCGKTVCLSKLANYFAKIEGSDNQRIEGLELQFNNVIVISYSLFDSFKKPFELRENNDTRKHNNYVYCGLIGRNGVMSIDEMKKNYNQACDLIEKKRRGSFFATQIQNLLIESSDCSRRLILDFNEKSLEELGLSSGQYFLLLIISEVIANIEEESIILIDEPEMHLHPNATSNLLKILYSILKEYNSYCIVATHSPIIVQEMPRKYVKIMDRDENSSFTLSLPIETFGNELSLIVDKIFDVDIRHSNYKSILEAMVNDDFIYDYSKTKDEVINSFFDNLLSFNARVFIRSLLSNEEGRNSDENIK